MKLYRIFKQYIWLLNTIYKAKRITLREINEKWQKTEMSYSLLGYGNELNIHYLQIPQSAQSYKEFSDQMHTFEEAFIRELSSL